VAKRFYIFGQPFFPTPQKGSEASAAESCQPHGYKYRKRSTGSQGGWVIWGNRGGSGMGHGANGSLGAKDEAELNPGELHLTHGQIHQGPTSSSPSCHSFQDQQQVPSSCC